MIDYVQAFNIFFPRHMSLNYLKKTGIFLQQLHCDGFKGCDFRDISIKDGEFRCQLNDCQLFRNYVPWE
jgi:hypothetical protein